MIDLKNMKPATNSKGDMITIGGSDIAPILGISPFAGSSPWGVYAKYLGISEPFEQTEAMEWGLRKEQVIIDAWCEKNGRTSFHVEKRVGDEGGFYNWAHSSPDSMTPSNETESIETLEIKTASQYSAEDWEFDIPSYYKTQGRWYMWLRNSPAIHFAVLIGSSTYKQFTMYREQDEEEQMIMAIGEWYHKTFIEGIAPEQPTDEDEIARLAELSKDGEEYTAFEGEIADLFEVAVSAYERYKTAEVDFEQAKAEILRQTSGYSKVKSLVGSVSWVFSKEKPSTDWESVALAAGATSEIIDSNTVMKKGKDYPRFTFKK